MTYKSYADREKKVLFSKLAGQLRDLAGDVVKQAQENVNKSPPYHPQVKSGTLRRAIIMDVDEAKLEAKVGIMKGSDEKDQVLVYARPLEFGSADGTRPPYPWLFPAADEVTRRAKGYFK